MLEMFPYSQEVTLSWEPLLNPPSIPQSSPFSGQLGVTCQCTVEWLVLSISLTGP